MFLIVDRKTIGIKNTIKISKRKKKKSNKQINTELYDFPDFEVKLAFLKFYTN